MNTKLTLNIDESVIERAKIYARKRKRSVSKLVEDYLAGISSRTDPVLDEPTLGKMTRGLLGAFRLEDDSKDYRTLLEEAIEERNL